MARGTLLIEVEVDFIYVRTGTSSSIYQQFAVFPVTFPDVGVTIIAGGGAYALADLPACRKEHRPRPMPWTLRWACGACPMPGLVPFRGRAAPHRPGDCGGICLKTYGFDYAFALSVDQVNQTLKKNLSGISMTVYYETVDADTGSTIVLDASLAPWQIVRGGQNTLLNFSVPFADGSLVLKGGALPGNYNLQGVSVAMQISLAWMGAGDQQEATGSGDVTKLAFNPSNTTNPANPGYVASLTVSDPNHHLDTVATGLIKTYMAAALVANKQKLQYIFANVNPTPANLQSWLRPVKWLYFYLETPSLSFLSFLCMLTDAPFPQPAFDSSALDGSSNSVLLISAEAFFANVVLPGVKAAFPHGSFTLSCQNDYCTIGNKESFDVGRVQATSFHLTPSDDGNGLKTVAKGGGPLKFLFGLANLPNASYSWEVDTVNPLRYSDGQVSFADDPKPTKKQDHSMPWYDWPLVVVLGITNVAGLVSLILDLVNNFYDQVDKVGMSTINSNVSKSTGGSVVNLSTLIKWNKDGQTFHATTAGLSGALYVRGNLS